MESNPFASFGWILSWLILLLSRCCCALMVGARVYGHTAMVCMYMFGEYIKCCMCHSIRYKLKCVTCFWPNV